MVDFSGVLLFGLLLLLAETDYLLRLLLLLRYIDSSFLRSILNSLLFLFGVCNLLLLGELITESSSSESDSILQS